MNSEQSMQVLQGKLNHDNVNFMGCLLADKVAQLDLKNKGGKPIALIANVMSTKLMGNWVAFCINGKLHLFF